jgi:hypothetical protein
MISPRYVCCNQNGAQDEYSDRTFLHGKVLRRVAPGFLADLGLALYSIELKIEARRERAPANVINLMDGLRRSVGAERGGAESF